MGNKITSANEFRSMDKLSNFNSGMLSSALKMNSPSYAACMVPDKIMASTSGKTEGSMQRIGKIVI